MRKRKTNLRIRKTHRYLGIIIGIQFLFWTISGLYFSWTNLDEIHGDHFKNLNYEPKPFTDLISPSEIDMDGNISSIELRGIDNTPYYWVNQTQLYNARDGKPKEGVTEEEALSIAERHLNDDLEIESIERIDATGKHHEYRERLLPAYVISYKTKDNVKAYVSIKDGKFQTVRHRSWRWFDFLWMTHTMDYEGRDNFNTLVLRAFSLLGLITVLSGFLLAFVSSRTLKRLSRNVSIILLLLLALGCEDQGKEQLIIQDLSGAHPSDSNKIWLSHEHLLVDFIGADSIRPDTWNRDSIVEQMLPYLNELKEFNVNYFVDATPNYLGRDVLLLEMLSKESGLSILTNTGLYGARNNKFIPSFAFDAKAEDLAEMWIKEFEEGIDQTSIRPGFIKISVDNSVPLDPMHQKLVKAAALTHLETGLTIASHTGEAKALWPQLKILEENGVSPKSFIWVHAQNEKDNRNYLKAAEKGCWISLDGLGWEFDQHVEKLVFAKKNGILDHILISHDSGWYDPQKEVQSIQPYTVIFKKLIPELKDRGFSQEEIYMLVRANPLKAYALRVWKSNAP